MQKFLKYNIKPIIEQHTPNLASFVFAPLEQGMGTTIGNALRRVLLSSIPGASVFAIKIPGVTHEHTTLKDVVEDLNRIILNLKKLVLKVNEKIANLQDLDNATIETWPTLKIEKKTAGVVYASDIICLPGFEVLNPELKLFEITSDRNFVMNLYVTYDRGFRTEFENQEAINSLNIIAIDSLFSPILKVAYKVEEEKTSKKGITDRLILDVATNGSILPTDALAMSAKILEAHFLPVVQINEAIANIEVVRKDENIVKKSALSTPIDELELTMRSFNCLKRAAIHTIQELIDKPKSEVEKIRNLGKKSLKEITRKLIEHGLNFKEE